MKLVLILLAVLAALCSGQDFAFETDELPGDAVMPTLANGNIGFTVFGPSILLNSLFSGFMGHSHRARIPNFSNIQIENCVRENKTPNDDCTYTLDEKGGFFKTLLIHEDYDVEHIVYANRYYDRAIVNLFTLRKKSVGSYTINLAYDDGGESPDVSFLEEEPIEILGKRFTKLKGNTKEIEDSNYQKELREFYVLHQERVTELTVGEDEETIMWQHVTFVDFKDEVVLKEANDFLSLSELEAWADHVLWWYNYWIFYGITVEGDQDLGNAIHTSLFFLFSSLPSIATNQPRNEFYGLSPSGLGRGGIQLMEYQGHSFWDTEIWMQPPLLMIDPQFSKELLHYRYLMREATLNHATETGYKGLRFVWESAFTGREVTPPCCPEVVLYQHHITADIAYAARSYFFATRDFDWLKEEGCFLATKTAEFWESHVVYNEETRLYEILQVMGPDEDHSPIDNNAYTNVIAAYNLYFGEFVSCLCKSVLSLEEYQIVDKWSNIAKSIMMPHNEELDYTPQFDGYNNSIIIKQADAVLLGYPLQYPMDSSTMKNNLLIYDEVTRDDGPAMTWAMHAIGYLDIGEPEKAYQTFKRGYEPYLRKPFMVWSEVTEDFEGAGNFITGAGGFLQSVINGYGGIRYHPERLEIKRTNPPPGTTSLLINMIQFLGTSFTVHVQEDTTIITIGYYNTIHQLSFAINGAESSSVITFELKEGDYFTAWPKYSNYGECHFPENKIGIPKDGAAKTGVTLLAFVTAILLILIH